MGPPLHTNHSVQLLRGWEMSVKFTITVYCESNFVNSLTFKVKQETLQLHTRYTTFEVTHFIYIQDLSANTFCEKNNY